MFDMVSYILGSARLFPSTVAYVTYVYSSKTYLPTYLGWEGCLNICHTLVNVVSFKRCCFTIFFGAIPVPQCQRKIKRFKFSGLWLFSMTSLDWDQLKGHLDLHHFQPQSSLIFFLSQERRDEERRKKEEEARKASKCNVVRGLWDIKVCRFFSPLHFQKLSATDGT